MKSTKAAHGGVDLSTLSVPEAEEIIEEALNELAFSPDPGLARALHFLALPDTRRLWNCAARTAAANAAMPLRNPGRPKKTRWRIYFERIGDGESAPRAARAARIPVDHGYDEDEDDDGQEAVIPADLDAA